MSLYKYFLILLIFSIVAAQPRVTIEFGTGFYDPEMEGFDKNELIPFPTGNVATRNTLLNFSYYRQFFSNARWGYSSYSSYDFGRLEGFETSKPIFYRTIRYRLFALQTFYRPKPKIELNFTLAPIWGRAKFTLETKPSSNSDIDANHTITDDWNDLLNSFGDDNPLDQIASANSMKTDWLGYTGVIGLRYYIRTWLGLEFSVGFLNNNYKKDKWRLQGNDVKGPDMKINDLPVFTFKIVYALK